MNVIWDNPKCGGVVIETISMLITKLGVAGVSLNEREIQMVNLANVNADIDRRMKDLSPAIMTTYPNNDDVTWKDDAGFSPRTDWIQTVWRDNVSKQDVVILGAMIHVSSMALWTYRICSLHDLLQRKAGVDYLMTLVSFHQATNERGEERFTLSPIQILHV